MKYYKKLQGERIYLSPLNIEDAEKYVEFFSDFSTTDGFGNSHELMSVESERARISKSLENCNYSFSIVKNDNDELIGGIKLVNINQRCRTCDIAIIIGKEENRNMGYGKDALNLALDFAFNYLNMNSIMIGCYDFNKRAIKCYQSVGFKIFGTRRQNYYLDGKYYNNVFMDVLKEEFTGLYIKNRNI